MSLISMQSFSFQYPTKEVKAVQNIDLEILEGDFMLICGRSASGKSTLLRCLKENITPIGAKTGTLKTTLKSSEIGIVFQNPDSQLVNNTVLSDLAFSMENLGIDNLTMQRRMAEMVGFFGIESIIHADPTELSGGQRQLVVMCAAMMTRPKLLLLDEPVSQLDPINAQKVLDILARLNTDLGVTIVMAEHRLDECISVMDKLVCLEEGKVVCCGKTKDCLRELWESPLGLFVPDLPRLSMTLTKGEKVCLNFKEWKNDITTIPNRPFALEVLPNSESGEKILSIKNLFYAYENTEDYVIKNLSFSVTKGSRICILGGNGSGKTTLLKLVANIFRPIHGQVKYKNLKVSYFPQDVYSYFRFESVLEEIEFGSHDNFRDSPLFLQWNIGELLNQHPMDLSGGEAAKVVLFCIMSKQPDLILLDEPTKGLDPYAKAQLTDYLLQTGTSAVCATHDIMFAAHFATSCALLFDGAIASSSPPRSFFNGGDYYTTQVSKCMRNICDDVIVYEDMAALSANMDLLEEVL